MPAKHKRDEKPLICHCVCPYCEIELVVAEAPFCQVCKVTFERCPRCGAPVVKKKDVKCPGCGQQLT